MPITSPGDTVLCPDCGSINRSAAARCFLCGNALDSSTPRRVQAETDAPGPSDFCSLILVTALAVVGIGLGFLHPGLLIPYVLVTTPALISMHVKSSRHEQQGRPLTPADKIFSFFVSAMVTIGALVGISVILIVAGVLLLMGICLRGGPMNFH
jgi:hypothetical protein